MTYKHLIFDLDHTLWDYNTNAKETLFDLFDSYGLGAHELFTKDEFYSTFMEINDSLWVAYNNDQLPKGYIRDNRFKLIFERLQLPLKYYPSGIDNEYLHSCPQKTHKIPYADELLQYLKPKYGLHILTNGFNDVQSVKLNRSGLDQYFQHVVTSESVGAKKPAAEVFDYTLTKIGATKSEVIMIGDNPNTDIKGARDFGIDQVYFNPEGTGDVDATYVVNHLKQLVDVF